MSIDSRSKVLARVREALRVKASPRFAGGTADTRSDHAPGREWLPRVGLSGLEQFELFAKNARELKAEFHEVVDESAAVKLLRELSYSERWKSVAAERGGSVEPISAKIGCGILWVDRDYSVADMERCGAGISSCECLVAQTGSVLVSSRANGGRALSVLPPHHVVLARREQMVSDLASAYARVRERYGSDMPSMLSFITGPSRTGDIERVLVLGAHGPKRLSIIVW